MTKDTVAKAAWDRREGETTRAYNAFCVYRDLGSGRTIPDAVAVFGSTVRTLQGWSHKYDWVDRCTQFDDWVDRQRREALISAEIESHSRKIEEFRGQNEKVGRALFSAAAQMLELAQTQLQEMKKEKVKLHPRDLQTYVRSAGQVAVLGSQLIAESLGIEKMMNTLATEEQEFHDND